MTPFELFFSLFGLILGLAVAVLISGLSDILRERSPIPIGWLTPMLALFLLLDLSTMWVNAYNSLGKIQIAFAPFFGGTLIAGLYFFAANMVFPKNFDQWPSLDEYYFRRSRYVLGGVLLANLGVELMGLAIDHDFQDFIRSFYHSEMTALWWVTLLTLLVVRHRRVQYIGLTIELLTALYALVMFWRPI
ncbi:hypothetical protein LZ518_04675 [Sphingomonas sp. RB56-2]|uniref:Uncharacterized protein n=1 Tax=Sphingomonas brevis TaxID=2908206 RepID=A0ABT0S7P6_9SPHN|nr:hypothetical protein [Sphingomonas brevis]MCL6740424.1 hypothetical protein [Sphingomonas brevis]